MKNPTGVCRKKSSITFRSKTDVLYSKAVSAVIHENRAVKNKVLPLLPGTLILPL